MLRLSTQSNSTKRPPVDNSAISKNIRLIFETDNEPEVAFYTFGVRAALASTFGANSTCVLRGYGTLQPAFLDNLVAFVDRAARAADDVTDPWCLYFTTSSVPFVCDGEDDPIPFVVCVALRPGRTVGVLFEPLEEQLSASAERCVNSILAAFKQVNHLVNGTDLERIRAQALMKTVRLGVIEGCTLQYSQVEPAYRKGN